MRTFAYGTILAVSLIMAVSSVSYAGSLQFCRKKDMDGPPQWDVKNEDIRLPPFSAFGDLGRENDKDWYGHEWPLTVIIVKPLELLKGRSCATVEARISPQSKVRSVDPRDNRHLEFSGFVKRDGSDDLDAEVPENYIRIFDADVRVVSRISDR